MINLLSHEELRPVDLRGISGGVVDLNKNIDTIIITDLHGRVYFIKRLLEFEIDGNSILDLLQSSRIQVVCVGDGMHSEQRGKSRWLLAQEEFEEDFKTHINIDKEMFESLKLMELIMELKLSFPNQFHFLKGNHENILNEDREGNYPFGKFAEEGAMTKSWFRKSYGEELLYKYSAFEKQLPLLAVGQNFMVTHAEPKKNYSRTEVINGLSNSDIIYHLTWTRNNDAALGSVQSMLKEFSQDKELQYCFAGHRPIKGTYNVLDNGLVQIHNPKKMIIALIQNGKKIDLDSNIFDLDANGEIDG